MYVPNANCIYTENNKTNHKQYVRKIPENKNKSQESVLMKLIITPDDDVCIIFSIQPLQNLHLPHPTLVVMVYHSNWP